ncbi:MAG: hypothetical protein M4579_005467, partial [Chaenotheca gracillima]
MEQPQQHHKQLPAGMSAYAYPGSYPSPTHSDSNGLQQHSVQGLGLLGCSMSTGEPSISSVMPPSPPPSELWTRAAALQDHSQGQTSQAPPDIFSAAYDPFASFQTPPQAQFVDPHFSQSPSNVPDLTSSPSTSCDLSSSRSSFASFTQSPPFAHQEDMHGKVKGESSSTEWLNNPNNEAVMSGQLVNQDFISVSQSPFEPSYEAQSYSAVTDWSRMSSTPMEDGVGPFEQHREDISASPSSTTSGRARSASGSFITNVARTRKRRQLTTAAEANHECRICGKLFGRSYNFKAHMETHDPSRTYPHPCTVGKCGKKFVRKTDLTRHHQSVHMKQRNYQCELCGNMFARKDTLRRHTEDGCSKRFEISSKGKPSAGSVVSDSAYESTPPPSIPVRTAVGIVPMRPSRQHHHHLTMDTANLSHSPSASPVSVHHGLPASATSHPHHHAHPSTSSAASSHSASPAPPG